MSEKKRSFIDITTDIVMAKDDFSLTDQEIKEKLAGLYTELAKKEDGVYWFYKKLDKDIELAKEYKEKIEEEIKKRQTAQKNLKDLVIKANISVDKVPKHSDFNPIKVMESVSVDIKDESIIPQQYWVEHRVVKLDKKNLLKDLKKGKEIAGAELKKNPYVKGLK